MDPRGLALARTRVCNGVSYMHEKHPKSGASTAPCWPEPSRPGLHSSLGVGPVSVPTVPVPMPVHIVVISRMAIIGIHREGTVTRSWLAAYVGMLECIIHKAGSCWIRRRPLFLGGRWIQYVLLCLVCLGFVLSKYAANFLSALVWTNGYGARLLCSP